MKTIVNIISSESPVPAYLFIREKYVTGDKLLFIAAKDAQPAMEQLIQFIKIPKEQIESIVFYREGDDFTYERICRKMREVLKKEEHYYVNLAGGSRYMALAIQQAFSKMNSDFFYVNVRDNTIVKSIFDDSIDDDDDYVYPIVKRLSIGEYLSLHGMQHDADERSTHKPIRSEDYVSHVFELFVSKQLNNRDYEILETLRTNYRNSIRDDQWLSISRIENGEVPHCYAIPDLSKFLKYIGFIPTQAGKLTKQELDFLTGGWFEEYCYYLAEREFQPEDILIGVHIARPNIDHDNELDVIFIKENDLHVIECKSGISNTKLFNEIIYKACALKEALLGLKCHYHLYTLKKDDEQHNLRKFAAAMGISFSGYEALTSDR